MYSVCLCAGARVYVFLYVAYTRTYLRAYIYIYIFLMCVSTHLAFHSFIQKYSWIVTFKRLSVRPYSSVHPASRPSIHPSTQPSICPSYHPSTDPSIHQSITPCMHACIHSHNIQQVCVWRQKLGVCMCAAEAALRTPNSFIQSCLCYHFARCPRVAASPNVTSQSLNCKVAKPQTQYLLRAGQARLFAAWSGTGQLCTIILQATRGWRYLF